MRRLVSLTCVKKLETPRRNTIEKGELSERRSTCILQLILVFILLFFFKRHDYTYNRCKVLPTSPPSKILNASEFNFLRFLPTGTVPTYIRTTKEKGGNKDIVLIS